MEKREKDKLIESLNPEWKELSEDDKGKFSQSKKEEALLRTCQSAVRNDKREVMGLIISAGLSSRMGKFKPLLKYDGETFLVNIIKKLQLICSEIIVVSGYKSELINKEIENNFIVEESNLRIINNIDYVKGMFTSLKKGIEAKQNSQWILYHQIDQPNLPKDFYLKFIQLIDNNYDWIQPRVKNKNGHPILLGENIIKRIMKANDKDNLRTVSSTSNIKKKYWECEYQEIFTDVDTKLDLDKLKWEEND